MYDKDDLKNIFIEGVDASTYHSLCKNCNSNPHTDKTDRDFQTPYQCLIHNEYVETPQASFDIVNYRKLYYCATSVMAVIINWGSLGKFIAVTSSFLSFLFLNGENGKIGDDLLMIR